MKRYDIAKFSDNLMHESEDGAWVKYDDIPECNCMREQQQPTGLICCDIVKYDRWICPVHGYKKL